MPTEPTAAVTAEKTPEFIPKDIAVRRQILEDSLAGARQRWYAKDLERLGRELTLKQIDDGKFRADKHKADSSKGIRAQLEIALAQVASDMQQIENEIVVYSEALSRLPKDNG